VTMGPFGERVGHRPKEIWGQRYWCKETSWEKGRRENWSRGERERVDKHKNKQNIRGSPRA